MSQIGSGASIFPAWFHYFLGGGSTLPNGLVSYWKLDEASGARADILGAYNLSDINTVGSAAGMHNLGASFTAINQESLTNAAFDQSIWQDGGEWTVSGWYKSTRPTNNGYDAPFSTYAGYSYLAFTIPLDSTNLFFQWNGYTGDWRQMNYNLSPGDPAAWYHYAIVKRPAGYHLFINGVERASVVDSRGIDDLGAGTYQIFMGVYAGSVWSQCVIDEVGFWNRGLIDDEITELYAAGAGKFYPFS